MSTSVEENLARVRSSLNSHAAEDTNHGDILDAYADAIREHEASMAEHRQAIDDYSSDRRKKRRKRDHDHTGKDQSSMRFRFKSSKEAARQSHRTSSHNHDHRRRHRSTASPLNPNNVDRYSAHPLPRPSEDAPWLDPTLSPSSSPDHLSRNTRASYQAEDEDPRPDPDAAFTDSLLDALADDEGAAAYWEAVYAQPLHVYPRPKVVRSGSGTPSAAGHDDDGQEHKTRREKGEGDGPILEEMSDEQYAAYVKRKMWERANPHLVREMRMREERAEEEQRRKREGRSGQRTRTADAGRGGTGGLREVDAALERGERRKEEKRYRERWSGIWERYIAAWRDLDERSRVDGLVTKREVQIPWPVEGGRLAEAEFVQSVKAFFDRVGQYVLPHLPGVANQGEELDLKKLKISMLKAERFRWHPDKIQHRFGGRDALGERTMESVTGVFQVVDQMLEAERKTS